MSALAQRVEPIRSRAYLDGSCGQPCTLRFVGICNHDPETTVAAHLHDRTFGLARKADDLSTVDACSSCHAYLDQGMSWKMDRAVLLEHLVRAIQETLRNRVERGILALKLDKPKPFADRPVKPRPPREKRRPIQGRPLVSRNDLKRAKAATP